MRNLNKQHINYSLTAHALIFVHSFIFYQILSAVAFTHLSNNKLNSLPKINTCQILNSSRKTLTKQSPQENPTINKDSILLLRSNGTLGELLLEKLSKSAYLVHTFRENSTNFESENIIKHQENPGKSFYDILLDISPKIIIDCAENTQFTLDATTLDIPAEFGSSFFNGDFSKEWKGMKILLELCQNIQFKPWIIYLSTIGSGDSENWIPGASKDTLKPWLDSKTRTEQILKDSNLTYTILRPCHISDEKESKSTILTKGPDVFGEASYEGVAKRIIDILSSERALNQSLAIVDSGKVFHTSPYVRPYEFYEPLPFMEFQT